MTSPFRNFSENAAARLGMEPGNFLGVCLGTFAGLALIANGAVGKHLGQDLDPFVIAFFRSALISVILFPWLVRNGYDRIRPSSHRSQIINGVVFTGAFVSWFWALPRVPLDQVAALGFTSQLVAIIGAIIFLGERSRPWRWGALGLGFLGAMIILRPGFVPITPGVIAVLVSAVLFSINRLIIKVIATRDNPETLVVWQAIWATVITLPLAVYAWSTPTVPQFLWLLVLAGLTIVSHYSLAWALRVADVAAVEPTTFMRLIWASLLGFAFFDEVPNAFTIAGGSVVLVSILYIARRERREDRAGAAAIAAKQSD